MPQEDNGPYCQYRQTYTPATTIPQFRGLYFPDFGNTNIKDTKGTVVAIVAHRAGDYLPIAGIEVTNTTMGVLPILLD